MSSFVLKIIAVISMSFDHIGDCITNGFISSYNFIGRFAFPVFAFQISEGYTHTHSLNNYIKKLFIFAVISQIPYNLFEYAVGFPFNLNVGFTLLIGLLAIIVFDKCPNKILGFLGAAGCSLLAQLLHTDYGYWGVLTIFCFYLFKNSKILNAFVFLLLVIGKYANNLIDSNFNYNYIMMALCTYLAVVPILLYNGKQGKKIKYFLYAFYPLHLLILGLIKIFI